MNYSITVIIPTYNSSSYIEKPILSVAKQSYSVKKIIIVDDNSEDIDELKVKLETLKKKLFSNIELIQNKENLGPGQSRNNAWKKCETNLIDTFVLLLNDLNNLLRIHEHIYLCLQNKSNHFPMDCLQLPMMTLMA